MKSIFWFLKKGKKKCKHRWKYYCQPHAGRPLGDPYMGGKLIFRICSVCQRCETGRYATWGLLWIPVSKEAGLALRQQIADRLKGDEND